MLMPPRLMLSQPTMKSVEKQSRDTPLQIIASFADSLAPSFSFLMIYPPNTMPTPALGTMITPVREIREKKVGEKEVLQTAHK